MIGVTRTLLTTILETISRKIGAQLLNQSSLFIQTSAVCLGLLSLIRLLNKMNEMLHQFNILIDLIHPSRWSGRSVIERSAWARKLSASYSKALPSPHYFAPATFCLGFSIHAVIKKADRFLHRVWDLEFQGTGLIVEFLTLRFWSGRPYTYKGMSLWKIAMLINFNKATGRFMLRCSQLGWLLRCYCL